MSTTELNATQDETTEEPKAETEVTTDEGTEEKVEPSVPEDTSEPTNNAEPKESQPEEAYQQTTLIDLEGGVPEPPTYYECLKPQINYAQYASAPAYQPPEIQGYNILQEEVPCKLAYADFLPRCLQYGVKTKPPVFDNFKSIMAYVNEWIATHREYIVLQCETLERPCKRNGTVEMDKTTYHQASHGDSDFVFYLRLWLVARPAEMADHPPQQLAYMNVVPKISKPEIGTGYPEFEGLAQTCQNFNEWMVKYPLPGKILTVETLRIKYTDTAQSNYLDPDESHHSDNASASKLYLEILRVYYVRGQPCQESIGIRNFPAEVTKMTAYTNCIPEFETTDLTVQRAGHWALNTQGIRVTNIQTIELLYTIEPGMGAERIKFNPDASWYIKSEHKDNAYFKSARICYVTSESVGPKKMAEFSAKTFTPARPGAVETVSGLVERINSWCQITGVNIIGVDTSRIRFNKSYTKEMGNEPDHVEWAKKGCDFMTVIRLYFDKPYEEPPPELQPQPNVQSASCTIL